MNTNIDNLIKKLIPFLVVVLLSYITALLIGFALPKNGINYVFNGLALNQENYISLFSQEQTQKVEKKNLKTVLPNETLKEFKLNAIYHLKDNSGWIILIKKNDETIILQNAEEINGYKLISLHKNHVIFEKNSKEYKIVLDDTISDIEEIIEVKEVQKTETKAIVKDGDLVSVNRKYLNDYVSNIDKIWQDITIKEIRNNRKIEGFEILNIKKGSDFEKLGLKKGDIIKSVNNKPLKSYADAFDIYNNKLELNYEIN